MLSGGLNIVSRALNIHSGAVNIVSRVSNSGKNSLNKLISKGFRIINGSNK